MGIIILFIFVVVIIAVINSNKKKGGENHSSTSQTVNSKPRTYYIRPIVQPSPTRKIPVKKKYDAPDFSTRIHTPNNWDSVSAYTPPTSPAPTTRVSSVSSSSYMPPIVAMPTTRTSSPIKASTAQLRNSASRTYFEIRGIDKGSLKGDSTYWRTGHTFYLRREKENKNDSNAIRVIDENGRFIAYVAREMAQEIAPQMDNLGRNFVVTTVANTYSKKQWGKCSAWIDGV